MSKSMPIVKHFNIELDKSQPIYKAGNVVKGKCHLNVEGRLQLKNLDINLICEGSVDCKDTKFDKQSMFTLIEKYDLMKRSATDQTLDGFIAIDFHFVIPEKGYPSSFYGKFGFIRYKIEAVVHKDWDIFRKEVILNVIAPFNGTADQVFERTIVRMVQKKIGFFNDFIELYTKVDKGWFTPGDKVSVYCNVDNPTDHRLKLCLSLYIKQNYYFMKIKSKISNEETFDLIEANFRNYSKRILLSIPSNLKTMSLESTILQISYEIRVSLDLVDSKDGSQTVKVGLPIVLTIAPKPEGYDPFDTLSLPPSYSDCQIFQRFASEDVCIPFILDDTYSLEKTENATKESEPSVFVDLPPTYAEAVFGYKLIT